MTAANYKYSRQIPLYLQGPLIGSGLLALLPDKVIHDLD